MDPYYELVSAARSSTNSVLDRTSQGIPQYQLSPSQLEAVKYRKPGIGVRVEDVRAGWPLAEQEIQQRAQRIGTVTGLLGVGSGKGRSRSRSDIHHISAGVRATILKPRRQPAPTTGRPTKQKTAKPPRAVAPRAR
jgi:hypothetical protein